MNIDLVKIKYDNTYCYKHESLKFCCNDLKNAYEDEYDDYPNIVLTNKHIWTKKDRSPKDLSLCISRDFYEDSYVSTKNYPINYCPYCGEKIKYTIDEEKDCTEFKTLIGIINDLQKHIENTDSRSRYKELCKYRDYIQKGLYTLEDINDFDTFKEKLALINMQNILAATDKIIKEKGSIKNESKRNI